MAKNMVQKYCTSILGSGNFPKKDRGAWPLQTRLSWEELRRVFALEAEILFASRGTDQVERASTNGDLMVI
jgi:hypothetical protein